MENVTTILKYSPNYDKIVNFLYQTNDEISKQLIEYFQDYLFESRSRYKTKMDFVLDKYTDEDEFFNYVQKYFSENEIYGEGSKILKKLCQLYDQYEKEKYQKINNARWI